MKQKVTSAFVLLSALLTVCSALFSGQSAFDRLVGLAKHAVGDTIQVNTTDNDIPVTIAANRDGGNRSGSTDTSRFG